jgi:hypothetical protein
MISDRWTGIIVAAASLVAVATAALAAIRYPDAVAGTQMAVVLAVTGLLLAAYLGFGLLIARGPVTTRGLGLWFGLAAGASWSTEIWAGGPALLSHAAEKATGATFALAATVITVAAGIAAGGAGDRPPVVWRTGLLAGAVSGALVYSYAVLMTLGSLPVLGSRADYQAQFATSTLPTINDFLVNDILGAAAAHLVINVVLGIVGACAGRLVYALRRVPGATAP